MPKSRGFIIRKILFYNDFIYIFSSDVLSQPPSYENLDVLAGSSTNASEVELELKDSRRVREPAPRIDERTPLDTTSSGGARPIHRPSMKRLVRQMSVMDTQRTHDGTMQLTHWI